MRKYLVDGAKWLYAFFILTVGYCMIQDIVSFHGAIIFRYSLLFLPVLIGCSVSVKKVEAKKAEKAPPFGRVVRFQNNTKHQ